MGLKTIETAVIVCSRKYFNTSFKKFARFAKIYCAELVTYLPSDNDRLGRIGLDLNLSHQSFGRLLVSLEP